MRKVKSSSEVKCHKVLDNSLSNWKKTRPHPVFDWVSPKLFPLRTNDHSSCLKLTNQRQGRGGNYVGTSWVSFNFLWRTRF